MVGSQRSIYNAYRLNHGLIDPVKCLLSIFFLISYVINTPGFSNVIVKRLFVLSHSTIVGIKYKVIRLRVSNLMERGQVFMSHFSNHKTWSEVLNNAKSEATGT